jgi:hypothetical protein
MRLLKGSHAALMAAIVALLIAACSVDGPPGEEPTQTATPTASPSPSPSSTPTATPSTPQVVSEYKVADYECIQNPGPITGFGGVFLEKGNDKILNVYLLNPHDKDAVDAAVCSFGYERDYVRILKSQFTRGQLDQWRRDLEPLVRRVPGLTTTGIDERMNKIKLGFVPLRGTRAGVEEAIRNSGVPLEAVNIEPRCTGIADITPSPRNLPLGPELQQALRFKLIVSPTVDYRETLPFVLKVTNLSSESIELNLGGRRDQGYQGTYNFYVTNSENVRIWSWLCGKTLILSLSNRTLNPGEELEFKGQWEQVDATSEAVPPGDYSAQAIAALRENREVGP